MTTIPGDQLEGLVSKHLLESRNIDVTRSASYDLERVDALDLFTSRRLDLAAKWLYIDHRERNVDSSFALDLYRDHLDAFSGGTFLEPGMPEKDSFDKYLRAFDGIIDEVRDRGFDESRSLIPVGTGGTLLDGSHRAAACAYFGVPVPIVHLPVAAPSYGFKFFESRGLDPNRLDQLVEATCEINARSYVAFIWPAVSDERHRNAIENLIIAETDVIGEISLEVDFDGLANLILQLYGHQDWVGTRKDNFRGVVSKAQLCFKPNGKLRVFAFDAPNHESVARLKQSIREVVGIGKHSVHITDTHDEAVQAVRIAFNANSRHMLEYGKPRSMKRLWTQLLETQELVESRGVDARDLVLDSGLVLAAYGLREANDVDVFARIPVSGIVDDAHQRSLEFHGATADDLICNPEKHFHFMDLKFLTLAQVSTMKRNRGESKDLLDLKLIDNVLTQSEVGLIARFAFNAQIRARRIRGVIAVYYWRWRERGVNLLKRLGVHAGLKRWIRGSQ